jgi:type I restriction enzyme S subunit
MAASGTTMQRISRTSLGNMTVPVTDYDEQVRITNYLDKKCAEIDAIITAKEKTNELLKERRQSIIYEAVTKGLDPTVPMKDSGIEWIGEIPESWDCKKIKYCFSLVAGATPKSGNAEYWDGDIVWITPADFTTEDVYIYAGHKTITNEGLDSCATTIVPEGSLIFSKRAPIGLVAINKVPLCTNQGCISCVPNEDIDSKFYYYMMSTFTKEFDLFGSGTTFKEISAEAFANFVLPNTSMDEQKEIAAYLDSKCTEINKLISANNSTIEKLKEYRQSIIYEAVTGKVEI